MTPPKKTRIRRSEFLRANGRHYSYTCEKILKMYPLLPEDVFIKEEYNIFVDTRILDEQNRILDAYLTAKNRRHIKKHKLLENIIPDKTRFYKVLEANNIETKYASDNALKYLTNLPPEALVKEGKKVFVLTSFLEDNLEILPEYRKPTLDELIKLAGFKGEDLDIYTDFLSANGLKRRYSRKDFSKCHKYLPPDFIVNIGGKNYVQKKYLKNYPYLPKKKKKEKKETQ